MRINDWSSDVCSSDLYTEHLCELQLCGQANRDVGQWRPAQCAWCSSCRKRSGGLHEPYRISHHPQFDRRQLSQAVFADARFEYEVGDCGGRVRSEEHTAELQSLMRISYAVFCLKQ